MKNVAWLLGITKTKHGAPRRNKNLRGAKLVVILDHVAWGGTRASPDTYIIRFYYNTDNPNPNQKVFPVRPDDLWTVGATTLKKLNRDQLANHPDYRQEIVSQVRTLPREHIPGAIEPSWQDYEQY